MQRPSFAMASQQPVAQQTQGMANQVQQNVKQQVQSAAPMGQAGFAMASQQPVAQQTQGTAGLGLGRSTAPTSTSTTTLNSVQHSFHPLTTPAPSSGGIGSTPAPALPKMAPPPRQPQQQAIADSHMTTEQRNQAQQQRAGVSNAGNFGSNPVTPLQASRMADPSKLPPPHQLQTQGFSIPQSHNQQSPSVNTQPSHQEGTLQPPRIGTAALQPPPGTIQHVPQGYYQAPLEGPSGAGAGAGAQAALPQSMKPPPRKKTYISGSGGVVADLAFDKPLKQYDAMPVPAKNATVLSENLEADTVVSAVLKGKSVTDCLIRHSLCEEVYLKACNVEGGAYSCCTFKKCKIKDLENSFDCRFEQCDFDGKCTPTRPTLSKCGWK